MAELDHQEKYLRTVLGFIRITDVEFVRAEGIAKGADVKQSAIDRALAYADTLGAREAVAA